MLSLGSVLTMLSFLGSKLPLIQAPMAGVQGSELAIAVCEAGAVGSLPCAMLGLDAIRSEFEKIRSATSRPFNANFFCHVEVDSTNEIDLKWKNLLSNYYRQFNLDIDSSVQIARRMPFNSDMVSLIEVFRPEIVSFHFGLPSKDLLARVKRTGAMVISTATTVAEAIWLEQNGADAVIAQGWEAGGHRGVFLSQSDGDQIGLMALLPQVADAIRVPVIAAGAIVDSRSVKAALTLGASAVQAGTAFLLCTESSTTPIHRKALGTTYASNTVVTNVFSGRPARGLINRLIREIGPLNSNAPPFPLASIRLAPLRQAAEGQGLNDFSPLWAGQNVQTCKAVHASEMVASLMSEFDF